MSRWRQGEAEVEQLLARNELQEVGGGRADGEAWLVKARRTLDTAASLTDADPENACVLAYDSARSACTGLLAQQGLRPTTSGGHVAVERAVRAQFGDPFRPYGMLRRRRNELEYPEHPEDTVDASEAKAAVSTARTVIEAAERLLPHLMFFGQG